MANDVDLTQEALNRLSVILPKRVPDFWAGFRPPVTDADLDALRSQVDPFELPESLVLWLRFADGQVDPGGFWWPTMDCGPMLQAFAIQNEYRFLVNDLSYPEGWLTISHASHYQCSLELVTSRTPVLIDTCVSDARRVIAPSLGASLWATSVLAEEGLLDAPWPDRYPSPTSNAAHARIRERTREIYDELGWNGYPIAAYADITNADYLAEWGEPGYVTG